MLTLAAKGLPAARRQTKVPLLAVAVKQSHPFIIAVLMELQAKLGRLLQDLASAPGAHHAVQALSCCLEQVFYKVYPDKARGACDQHCSIPWLFSVLKWLAVPFLRRFVRGHPRILRGIDGRQCL